MKKIILLTILFGLFSCTNTNENDSLIIKKEKLNNELINNNSIQNQDEDEDLEDLDENNKKQELLNLLNSKKNLNTEDKTIENENIIDDDLLDIDLEIDELNQDEIEILENTSNDEIDNLIDLLFENNNF